LNRKGEPTKNSTYDSALFKLCDKAGITRFSMHVLRHTMATRCIEGNMRPKTLQVILGHSNISITMNLYVHVTEDEKVKELEKIEMVRQLDNIYRLDHAVTANQKVILKAFGLDANSIKYFASELSKELKEAE